MSNYQHTRKFPIYYTDVDFKDELKPSSYLGYAQEAAATSADELGMGYFDLSKRGQAFIAVNNYCKIEKPIKVGDELSMTTWPLPPRLVIFERDYIARNQNGEVCARMASRWCLVDLKDFKLLKPSELVNNDTCPYNPEKSVEVPDWKIPKIGDDGEEVYSLVVRQSVCDHFIHMNNCCYASAFFDCFTMEDLKARRVTAFQIAYGKQVKEGETIVFYRKNLDDGRVLMEARVDGETRTQFCVWFE